MTGVHPKGTKSLKVRLDSLLDALAARGWEAGAVAGWDEELTRRNLTALCSSGLRSATLPLAAVAVELLSLHQPDTVRGVMYSVVSAGWLPDTSKQSYGRIQRILNDLRKQRVLPFDWVVDNIRSTIKPSSWTGLADFTNTVQAAYRLDFWASLPTCVVLIVEKDTVAGRIAPVTREYDVALHPLRGFSSTSFAWSIAKEWAAIEKPITAYYIGDHDPSGRDIERSVRATLREYADRDFEWERLAVEPEHLGEFNVIPLTAKATDTRHERFVEEYGEECAEVEAIPANELREMVRAAIVQHIPADEWERLRRVESAEREQWESVMVQLRGER